MPLSPQDTSIGPVFTSTTYDIAGTRVVRHLGLVRGIVVRAPTIGQGLMGGLKSIIGGNIESYADMCEQARQHAFDRLLEHARALGANAVVGIRSESADVGQAQSAATEVLCYGTALVVEMARA
jgi:uncharacterized protein YbjQ (UPF0145 family)